jgi:enoyl-[acyl-carrier protein] reductase I
MPSLAGKKALVTGVINRRSLAFAIAQALHDEGAELLLTYQGERVRESVEKLAAGLGDSPTTPLDVTDDAAIDAAIQTMQQRHGGLDILIHSIAFAPAETLSEPFVRTTREAFRATLDISAYSLLALARAAEPLMKERGGGSIVTLTYLGGERVVPNYNVMGVAKAALDATMRYLAYDLGPAQIRVNAISSGPVSTAASRGIAGFLKMEHQVSAAAPLRRKTDPAEVGATAAFLCSDAARGITGEVLHVDSGFNIMGSGTLAP